MSNTRYKIEEADGGFVLVEERTGPFPTEIRVPYSIAQEAESGTDAASRNGDVLRDQRKVEALKLARYAASFFIEKDPDAQRLLDIREYVEKLVTASIAELRKNAGIKNNPDSSAARPRKGETAEQCVARKMQKASQDL